MGGTYSYRSFSHSDGRTTSGTKSMSRGWNMEFVIVARPLGVKLYPKNGECLQIVSVNPEGVGNVVGFEFGDRIVGINNRNYGNAKRLLRNLQNCKLPMTLQVFRPDEVSEIEESEPFSHSRSISIESTTTSCNLCAICNLEETVLYVNPCYHDICHACWEEHRTRGEPEKCPLKCPLCRFPVKSAHPISHYHVPSQAVFAKVKPFVEVQMKWPQSVLGLVFEFLTFRFQVGQNVVVRDTDNGSCTWEEGIVTSATPLTVSLNGGTPKEFPEVLPIDEPRPELLQPYRSRSTEWPWPRPLNSKFVADDSLPTYSRTLAPKWFRSRKYYRKLQRLENELVAGLPCRPSRTWSKSARPSFLFTSTSTRSAPSEGSSFRNELTSSSFSEESFGGCSLFHFDDGTPIHDPALATLLHMLSIHRKRIVRSKDSEEDSEKQGVERMKQIVDFVYRLKARKS